MNLCKCSFHLNKVKRLRHHLLSWSPSCQHFMDVHHAPHSGAEERRCGVHASAQNFQQVPTNAFIKLQEENLKCPGQT